MTGQREPDLTTHDRRILTLELELTHLTKRMDASERRDENLKADLNAIAEKIHRAILWVAVGAAALVFNIIRGKLGM